MTVDAFTQAFQLCDDDGWVRRGSMWKGTDYACTGHAHFAGEHICCTNPVHVLDRVLPEPIPHVCHLVRKDQCVACLHEDIRQGRVPTGAGQSTSGTENDG